MKKKKDPTNSVSQKKGKSTDDNPEKTQMLELSGKKIKIAIITMLNEVKENIVEINKKLGNLREIYLYIYI